jgi:hypothetical protein
MDLVVKTSVNWTKNITICGCKNVRNVQFGTSIEQCLNL